MAAQDQIFARQRARNFPLTPDQSDNQQIADANYADAQKRWADPTNQRGPNSAASFSGAPSFEPNAPFTQTAAPQSAAPSGPAPSAWNTPQNSQALRDSGTIPGTPGYVEPTDMRPFAVQQRAGYIAAQPPQQQPPATRNNFTGAENAPEGSVVRGLDRMLYRRTGGNFVRVPPRSADEFDPTATDGPASQALKSQQTRYDSDVAAFGLGIANRNRQNAGLNSPTAQPDNGQRIGAINNMPNDATAAGLANKKHMDESLATSAYDFGVKQDELRDARVRASASTSGSYQDMNRRSPRFGTRVNWFDPGEVNPDAFAPKRPKPQFAL